MYRTVHPFSCLVDLWNFLALLNQLRLNVIAKTYTKLRNNKYLEIVILDSKKETPEFPIYKEGVCDIRIGVKFSFFLRLINGRKGDIKEKTFHF